MTDVMNRVYLPLTYQQLVEIQRVVGSSFYIFDVEKLIENYHKFYQVFSERYPNVIVGYSYKTNYLPYLCKVLQCQGAYAEVVSRLEYDLALAIGQTPDTIIFNGPLKKYEDISLALQNGSIVNLDSHYELSIVRKYCEAYPSQDVKVGLRVNFDLRDGTTNPLQDGFAVSRFGFCVENGNLEAAIRELQNINNLKVVGLHGHFSTDRSLAVYKKITQTLSTLAKTYLNDTIEYIDIGGGMFGELPSTFKSRNTPTFTDYATVICDIMEHEWGDEGPDLILEPGIALVANVFQFVCQVIDIKENNGVKFVLVNGSVHNIKPTMHRHQLPMRIVSTNPNDEYGNYHVVGYTCMEKDYLLLNYEGQIPFEGDFIIFEHVGAYTIVFDPPFIKERPAIVAINKEGLFLVRRKETFADVFSPEFYLFTDLQKIHIETKGGSVHEYIADECRTAR